MGGSRRGLAFFALACTLCCLALAAPALATGVPSSLKTSCALRTPAPGYSYQFCDDGLPPSGGRTPNPGGIRAVEVPARYMATSGNDWTGLPPSAGDNLMPGADSGGDIALDVDVSLPTMPPPPGGYPLIIIPHGCCANSKMPDASSLEPAGEFWHWSNAWFASRGYVVLTYTARGFVARQFSVDAGSTGEMHFDSRRFEINDIQHLAGLLADDPFFQVNPQKVLMTGGSYAGAATWLTLTDPVWTSPGGRSMKLAAVAPRYGWTDLVYSLIPNGLHSQAAGQLPAFSGADSLSPLGVPKKSILNFLYETGQNSVPPATTHTTFPPYIDELVTCFNSVDPFETNPLCSSTISTTLPEFIRDRSAYYQTDFFGRIASDTSYRVPVFNAATLTDPLFPPIENLRMSNRLQAVVPSYPIQQYFGDIEHFVQNKAREWSDVCGADRHICRQADYPGGNLDATPTNLVRTGINTRLSRFLDFYAQPPGNPSPPAPTFDVTTALQICPANAVDTPSSMPGPTFIGPTLASLAPQRLELEMSGSQTTTSDASPNAHAANSDPVANLAANGGQCPVENAPAGPGVATYDSSPLSGRVTMIGATSVTIDYSASSTAGNFQLNARLYDVFPDGTAVMVDRGVRRVTSPSGSVTYELHGNGWRFEGGHRVRIEIAQDDDPFLKASEAPSTATISKVRLSIPMRETTIGYPRPQAGPTLRVPLAIAYRECTAGAVNRTHGPALSAPSCNPAQPESSRLTVSTLDVNGRTARSVGSVKLLVAVGDPATPADEADVSATVSISDVLRRSDLADYTGETQASIRVRVTDKQNGPSATESATTQELPLSFAVPCAAVAGDEGSTCSMSTGFDALFGGAVVEGKRANWELVGVELLDGGADGVAATAPNTVFARQGIFVP